MGTSSANLKLRSGPVESSGKGKGKKEYAGVEEDETPLSKAAKDR